MVGHIYTLNSKHYSLYKWKSCTATTHRTRMHMILDCDNINSKKKINLKIY